MEKLSMSTPSFDDIKASTEKAVSFIDWLAEVLRGKNWVTKLLLLDVIIFAIFNPLFLPTILKLFISEPKLPGKYVFIFWLVIGIIFIIALIIAIRTKPKKTEAPAIELGKRSPIKGLRPFGSEDAEIFAKLQREPSIRECLEAITTADCRFGVLCGESGCGKTSFLQGGLIPRLKDRYQCIYVKFTELEPLDSIRQALAEQAQLLPTTASGDDLLALFQAVVQANGKPLVLFFDQFEQFFVHRKLKEQREPFIRTLANWYKHRPILPVKIIIGVRGDFKYRLDELQKAMGYSLGPQDSFTLEKFTPHEAASIFQVIADTEGIDCNADFVREIAEQKLAHEDGLISPVDIQILAWMIRGQKTAAERAFNRSAFEKLGGVEGLLERFLSRALDVRETEEQRQTAIKVLLALTDLERNVRAGLLTIENLKAKLAGSASDSEITEAVHWLSRGDVRLITPARVGANVGYELAHERLIPALLKLAGKQLSQADQANQLFNRRVNEWLGNEKESHYLLRWKELRKIDKQKNFLTWGENEQAKKELMAQSRSRQKRKISSMCACFIVLLIAWMLWPTFNARVIEPRQRDQRFLELSKQFVFVEGDTFHMGDSGGGSWGDARPVHDVILSDFKISRCEITNQHYCDFLNSLDTSAIQLNEWIDITNNYCHIQKRDDGKFKVRVGFEDHPVVTVTWYGAAAFCNYLSEYFGYRSWYNLNDGSYDSTANGYRLPTEAEWEFAARGGKNSQGYEYSGSDTLDLVAWNWSNVSGGPQPVATKQHNELGLYDMSGNVWEWCHDWYSDSYYEECYQQGTVTNPRGPTFSPESRRVLRGGSWSLLNSLPCSLRDRNDPDLRNYDVGFRVSCGA